MVFFRPLPYILVSAYNADNSFLLLSLFHKLDKKTNFMSQNPKFSIITVCRNHHSGLEKTYNSLKNQSFRGFEWIVIDGVSSDGTAEFLKQNALDFYLSEPDQGPYDAMNKGITHAHGQYLIFLNAGDSLENSNTLSLINQNIAQNPDFIYGDALDCESADNHYKTARSHEKVKLGMFTHHQSMIYKREKIGDLQYNTRYKIAADYDFTLRYLQRAKDITYIPQALCIFEAGGLSQNNAKLGRKEQSDIRQSLKICSSFENKLITLAQILNLQLRRFIPWAYWLSKRALRP